MPKQLRDFLKLRNGISVPMGSNISLLHIVQTGAGVLQPPVHWISEVLSERVNLNSM
jgi:hypothetical protein